MQPPSHIFELPNEVLNLILIKFTNKELLVVEVVCKTFLTFVNSENCKSYKKFKARALNLQRLCVQINKNGGEKREIVDTKFYESIFPLQIDISENGERGAGSFAFYSEGDRMSQSIFTLHDQQERCLGDFSGKEEVVHTLHWVDSALVLNRPLEISVVTFDNDFAIEDLVIPYIHSNMEEGKLAFEKEGKIFLWDAKNKISTLFVEKPLEPAFGSGPSSLIHKIFIHKGNLIVIATCNEKVHAVVFSINARTFRYCIPINEGSDSADLKVGGGRVFVFNFILVGDAKSVKLEWIDLDSGGWEELTWPSWPRRIDSEDVYCNKEKCILFGNDFFQTFDFKSKTFSRQVTGNFLAIASPKITSSRTIVTVDYEESEDVKVKIFSLFNLKLLASQIISRQKLEEITAVHFRVADAYASLSFLLSSGFFIRYFSKRPS